MRNGVERFGAFLVALPLLGGVCAAPFLNKLSTRGDVDHQTYLLLVVAACIPGLLIFALGRMMGASKKRPRVVTRVVYRDRPADALEELGRAVEEQE